MKKIYAFTFFMVFSAMITFAQSAAETKPADKKETIEQAAPAVKVVDMNQSNAKCSSANGTKSCCSGMSSRTSAVTAPATEITGTTPSAVTMESETTGKSALETTPAPSCHDISIGVSAAKPEETERKEDPKK